MTREEAQIEWNYLYLERIAMMCGSKEPTPDQDGWHAWRLMKPLTNS